MITTSDLRQNIYKLLDRVIETGEPLEIKRKGHVLRITEDKPFSKLANIQKREAFVDPEDEGDDIAEMDWSKEWHGDLS